MKQVFTLFTFAILIVSMINPLNGQDAAICGFNSDTNDGFAVVALIDIPASQKIFVTDAMYQPATNSFDGSASSNEVTVQIIWTGTWAKGTIIEVEETGTSTFTVTTSANGPGGVGVINVYSGDGFSIGNEGMSVFTASNASDPDNTVTEIYSYITYNDASSLDSDPSEDANCPCSSDFSSIDFGAETTDHYQFKPSLRGGAVSSAAFNNTANWDQSINNVDLSLTEFANLTFGGSSLPVTLTSFSAEAEDRSVRLIWQTASEINNDYFQVEYSIDGRSFDSIDRILGNGTTNTFKNYSYLHSNPKSGANYYRLKQVDLDGTFEYSKTVSISIRNDEFYISVFPNPFEQFLTVSISTDEEVFHHEFNQFIEIYDIYQRMIYRTTPTTFESLFSLDLSQFSRGIYFLKAFDGNRVIKQIKVLKL